MNKRLNINVCETFNPSRWPHCTVWRWCPSKTRLSPGEPLDFSRSCLDRTGLHHLWLSDSDGKWALYVDGASQTCYTLCFPRSLCLGQRQDRGVHHHLLPIVVFGLDWLLLFLRSLLNPGAAVNHMMLLRDPLAGRKEPRDIKPVASACLNRYKTPISSMITNLKQQKNWGGDIKSLKKA